VTHNLESQRLQYAMQDRLRQLGWREVEVVDEDLGRSAAGLVTRAGFERMVAEVCLGKVGRWRRARSRALLAIAGSGNNWSKCVGSSIPC
jgi:DNA invertase Pin-like site-specific DNA recombinase